MVCAAMEKMAQYVYQYMTFVAVHIVQLISILRGHCHVFMHVRYYVRILITF